MTYDNTKCRIYDMVSYYNYIIVTDMEGNIMIYRLHKVPTCGNAPRNEC